MRNLIKLTICSVFVAAMPVASALASVAVGSVVPIAEGGLLGLAAAGIIGGIWLARRKG